MDSKPQTATDRSARKVEAPAAAPPDVEPAPADASPAIATTMAAYADISKRSWEEFKGTNAITGARARCLLTAFDALIGT